MYQSHRTSQAEVRPRRDDMGPPAKRQRFVERRQQRPLCCPSDPRLPFPVSRATPPNYTVQPVFPRSINAQYYQQIRAPAKRNWKQPLLPFPPGFNTNVPQKIETMKAEIKFDITFDGIRRDSVLFPIDGKTQVNFLLNALRTSEGMKKIIDSIKPKEQCASPLLHPIQSMEAAWELMDMKLIRIRTPSVISSLHTRPTCHQCGLSFSNHFDPLFDSHREWHLKQFVAAAKQKKAVVKSRALYCTRKDWINAKTDANGQVMVEEMEKISHVSAIIEMDEVEDKRPAVNCDDVHSKSCACCGEVFPLSYDDDSDQWMMRDCVKVGSEIYHPSCAPDQSQAEITPLPTVQSASALRGDARWAAWRVGRVSK